MANGITINAFKKFEFLNEHHQTNLAEYGFYIYNYCRFKVFCNKGLKNMNVLSQIFNRKL